MIDNPTDLEEFLRTLGGGYHNGGHNAMAAGMYWCCLLKHEQEQQLHLLSLLGCKPDDKKKGVMAFSVAAGRLALNLED